MEIEYLKNHLARYDNFNRVVIAELFKSFLCAFPSLKKILNEIS